MNKIKTKLPFLSLIMAILLTGCGTTTNNSNSVNQSNQTSSKSENTNIVNIERLTGKLNNNKNRNINYLANETEEDKNHSYVLIYKSETDIELTITLNNPKASEINAVEITCDDTNSEILVDGEYKKIQYKDSEKSETKTRMVNWAQEDPYEKVFKMRTISSDNINTVKIVDLKVNGEWQGEELQNNRLDIYKMDANAYELKVLDNAYGHIDFEFNINDPEKILGNFKLNGNAIADKEHFTIDTDSYLNVSYDLIVNEKVVSSRSDEYRYEVRKFGCSKGGTRLDGPNIDLNYESALVFGSNESNYLYILFNFDEYGLNTEKNKFKFIMNEQELEIDMNRKTNGSIFFGEAQSFYGIKFENNKSFLSTEEIKNNFEDTVSKIIIKDSFSDNFKLEINSVTFVESDEENLQFRSIYKLNIIKI